jgi:hypothetical protein
MWELEKYGSVTVKTESARIMWNAAKFNFLQNRNKFTSTYCLTQENGQPV